MRTLQENLETVEDCRALKYESSLGYEPEEDEMIEHDIYVKMPPRKKYSIKAKITRIRKAELV